MTLSVESSPGTELALKPAAQISKNSETTHGTQTLSRPNFTSLPPLAYTSIFEVMICLNWDPSESKSVSSIKDYATIAGTYCLR